MLEYAEKTEYPISLDQLLTTSTVSVNAPEFKGPVLYLTGERDQIFCGGECKGLFGAGSNATKYFPASEGVQVSLLPGFGHAINLHLNATAAFDVAYNVGDQAWLVEQCRNKIYIWYVCGRAPSLGRHADRFGGPWSML